MEKIKLLVWGDAVAKTGFSRVLHSILENLSNDEYDISWIGVNYFGDPHNYPYKIYPPGNKMAGDVYGFSRFSEILTKENPDLIFLLNDAWITGPALEVIKNCYKGKTLPKIITYIPVDAEDHDSDWYKHFNVVSKVVAYTEFGKTEILKAAPQLEDKMLVIPHGVNTDVFFKINMPQIEIKKAVYAGFGEDFYNSFIFLSASRNQPRKRLDILLESFKLFSEDKPENVKLYLHCGLSDSHLKLKRMVTRLKVDNRIIFTSNEDDLQSVPESKLNLIYNATDVGMNTSMGEGFSLTQIEHAVTGAPQIVPNHSAMRELYSDCGLLVNPTMNFVFDKGVNTTGKLVRPEDVAKEMELIYTNKKLYSDLSLKSIVKFSDEKYSWKYISSQWNQLFKEVL